MRCSRGFSLRELITVVCIIAILTAIFLYQANEVIDAAYRTTQETLGRNFASAMASLRGKWIVEGGHPGQKRKHGESVLLANHLIYLNEFGWPANTNARSNPSSSTQTPTECQQLWEAITRNPLPATTEEQHRGEKLFHISTPENHICRFELTGPNPGAHYFDYNLKTGRVDTHPLIKHIVKRPRLD